MAKEGMNKCEECPVEMRKEEGGKKEGMEEGGTSCWVMVVVASDDNE